MKNLGSYKGWARWIHRKSHNIFHAPAIQATFSDGPKLPISVLSKNHFTIFTKIMKPEVLFV